ncbi:hypothetical protein lbkm_3206 [Lachnospiraceae bacterium KM106-2]|nr:hypothetical protein lbkm_3206 [Lachnospiraceae bacterium KM106-2]
MSAITLSTNQINQVTIISNIFIDEYMPGANGSYVKVYLYLLRCISNNYDNLSIEMLADHLDNTEKDIERALNYWEKLGLITLFRDGENQLIGININNIEDMQKDPVPTIPAVEPTPVVQDLYKNVSTPVKQSLDQFDKPTYSQAQIDAMLSHDEIQFLMNVIERYLERLLKPNEIQLILYLYESVGFSAELIMYLYEYCISKDKKSSSYIEAVALSWANEGIDTVEKAENSTTIYNTNYQAINKAFGLNRAPGSVEKQFINKWFNTYHFSIDIIVEACNRTILRVGKPDFKYADKILENWSKQKVRNLQDITKLDQEHAKHVNINKNKVPIQTQTRPSNNKFTAFAQRSYTKEDFSKMEQHLLNKK